MFLTLAKLDELNRVVVVCRKAEDAQELSDSLKSNYQLDSVVNASKWNVAFHVEQTESNYRNEEYVINAKKFLQSQEKE